MLGAGQVLKRVTLVIEGGRIATSVASEMEVGAWLSFSGNHAAQSSVCILCDEDKCGIFQLKRVA